MRFIWTADMKIPDCERGVSQVDSWLPGALRIIVADPIHEVVEPAAPKLGVEDHVNLELGQPVHLTGQGRGHDTARERVATCSSRRLTWNTGWMFMDRGSNSL